MKTNISKATQGCFFLLVAGFTLPASAWVQSVSLERAFVGENIRVLEVEVSCKFYNQGRRLRKVVSQSKPWCSVDVPDLCATRKIVLARKVCNYSPEEFEGLAASKRSDLTQAQDVSTARAKKVKATEAAAKANTSENLLQEQMLIEEQRIQIQQQRLELRKRELALKKELSKLASL